MQPAIALQSVATNPVDEDQLVSVYRYATTNGGIAEVQDVAADLSLEIDEVSGAVEQLIENRLLREDRGSDRYLVAVDPEIAAATLVSPMEREIYRRREQIAQIKERTDRYRQDYFRMNGDASSSGPAEVVTGSMEVRGYLKVASEACREEIMVLQSGKQDVEEFNDLLRVCERLRGRGVAVRVVCQHRSRADLITRMKIKSVGDAGGEVRTLSHIPRTAVVFDQSKAVLLGTSGGETTASVVNTSDVIEFLLDLFNHLWEAATVVDCFESGYAEVADDLQRTIAGLMAQGFTDEVLARKLGMSVRSARRHIAVLMRELNAVSRFQAGVQAGRHSLVPAS